jgi:hypothetical protein
VKISETGNVCRKTISHKAGKDIKIPKLTLRKSTLLQTKPQDNDPGLSLTICLGRGKNRSERVTQAREQNVTIK